MDPTTLINYIGDGSYIILFLLMLIEGPISTTLAGFFSTYGYFALPLVFLVAVLGDFTSDLTFFLIGRSGKCKPIKKTSKKLHIGKTQIEKIKQMLETHPAKTIFCYKMTPTLGIMGVLLTGSSNIKTFKALSLILTFSIINKICYLTIGLLAGLGVFYLFENIGLVQIGVPAFVISAVIIVFSVVEIRKIILKQIQNKTK